MAATDGIYSFGRHWFPVIKTTSCPSFSIKQGNKKSLKGNEEVFWQCSQAMI